jgi:3-deoxy-D-manno-octulosonate 8-phosphate phosphatase (KDO 8-P phosphatase)
LNTNQSQLQPHRRGAQVPAVFILDVDGVLSTGQFFYTADGKAMKVFGADDNDALALLEPFVQVRFVTGDRKGLAISRKRIVEDMGYPLDLVSTTQRLAWIAQHHDPASVVYMGDGIFDHHVMRGVAYAIAPANADSNAKASADFVTQRAGGDRAVAEACLHLLERYFTPYDPAAEPTRSAARATGDNTP